MEYTVSQLIDSQHNHEPIQEISFLTPTALTSPVSNLNPDISAVLYAMGYPQTP
jgi:hypothetical protein